MFHISEDILRRYVDEPDALLTYEKEHLLQCSRCRARLEAVRAAASFASGHLDVNDVVDLQTARAGVSRRLGAPPTNPVGEKARPAVSMRFPRAMVAVAASLALFVLLGYTPLRGVASNFLSIFEPRQFQPIGFTASDAANSKAWPALNAFGTMHESGARHFLGYGANRAAASSLTHMQILRPGYLPNGVPTTVMYHASLAQSMTFTFKPSKAHPMPAGIAGSTIRAAIGPIVVQTYGEKAAAASSPKRHGHRLEMNPGLHSIPQNMLVISQAPTPKVYSTKATVAQIEAWMLAQPGIPPGVVAQIKAIGDPATTLPVPIQLDKQMAQPVSVQGVSGLMIGDNTGVGSLVMWQKDGMVYGVAGPYTTSEILQVANSLAR